MLRADAGTASTARPRSTAASPRVRAGFGGLGGAVGLIAFVVTIGASIPIGNEITERRAHTRRDFCAQGDGLRLFVRARAEESRNGAATASAAAARRGGITLSSLPFRVRRGQVQHRRRVSPTHDGGRDQVMRHRRPPVRQSLARQLLRREQIPLRAQAIRPATIAYIPTHRTPPLRIRHRLVQIFPHAHLQAPPAPRPSSPSSLRRSPPRSAHARRLRVRRLLSTKVARRALSTPRVVHVLTPRLTPARVSSPPSLAPVQPIVVRHRVVFPRLALRRAQRREFGSDRPDARALARVVAVVADALAIRDAAASLVVVVVAVAVRPSSSLALASLSAPASLASESSNASPHPRSSATSRIARARRAVARLSRRIRIARAPTDRDF